MQEQRLTACRDGQRFTEIVGYTHHIGSDDKKAFQILRIDHNIHDTLIKRYNGILIKEISGKIYSRHHAG